MEKTTTTKTWYIDDLYDILNNPTKFEPWNKVKVTENGMHWYIVVKLMQNLTLTAFMVFKKIATLKVFVPRQPAGQLNTDHYIRLSFFIWFKSATNQWCW